MDPTNEPEPITSRATSVDVIQAYLRDHSDTLLRVIHSFVRRFHAAGNQPVAEAAREVLGDVAVQALAAAERFDPSHRPGAWLVGIAYTLVRHRSRALHALQKNESLASDISGYRQDESELDFFDRLAFHASHPEDPSERLAELLALVPPEDRELLMRIDLVGWRYHELAPQMGTTEAALRKRHQRIILRLHQLASHEGGQPE